MVRKILIYLIRAYQITPLHAHSMCRYTPTCSNYAVAAIETYGAWKGIILSIKRILRCRPFGGCGYDPLEKEGKR